MFKPECTTTNASGEKVTAHSHYRYICHAYPGPNGEVMVAGHVLSTTLQTFIGDGYRRREPLSDPADLPPPPCPSCGTPVDVDWIEVTAWGDRHRVWLPGEITCPANKRHNARPAAVELSWPVGLTDEDRVWLRRQLALTADEAS